MRPTPRWGRWLPGMKAVGRRDNPTAWFRLEEELEHLTGEWADATPDLDDAATVGCILELVRRAHANPDHLWGGRVEVHQDHRDIFVVVRPDHDPRSGALFHRCIATGTTEVEALVNALHGE